MHGVGGEQALLFHPFLDIGEIDQSNKRHEKLSFQGAFGGSHGSPQIQPLLHIPECFLHNIPHSVESEGSDRLLDFIANENEKTVPFMSGVNGVPFKGEGDSSFRSFLDFKAFVVILLMLRISFPTQEFRLQRIHLSVECFSIIGMLIRIEVQMEIHPAIFLNGIPFVGTVLFVVPSYCFRKYLQFQIAVVVLVVILFVSNFPDEFLRKTEGAGGAAQEFQMLFQ